MTMRSDTRRGSLGLRAAQGVILTGLVTGAFVGCGPGTGGAAPAVPGDRAVVRFLDAAPSSAGHRYVVTIGEQPAMKVRFGAVTEFVDVAAGPLQVGVEAGRAVIAAGTAIARAGCATTIVAAEPAGPGRGVQLLTFGECTRADRLPAANASVLLLNLTGDLGPVEVQLPGVATSPSAAPFSASMRVTVPAGLAAIGIRSADGSLPVSVTGSADFEPGRLYSIALIGAGETPIAVRVLTDASQPVDPPTDGPINTGVPTAGYTPRHFHRVAVEEPTRVTIPKLGVDAPVVVVDAKDAPDLPRVLDGLTVGWFSGSTKPGAIGTAVLAGHVSYGRSAAVFGELGALQPGDTVTTWDADQRPQSFTVREVTSAPKTSLPAHLYAPSYTPTLVLVSCTGPIVRGLHRDNQLVIATR